MLDHVSLNIRDYDVSRPFYERALAAVGIEVVLWEEGWRTVGFGRDGKPFFFIEEREPYGTGTHVAFTVGDRATVDAFHAAAIEAGGVDNGAPGIRWYHPNYYGAFVLDPDGNNIEAVCHQAESEPGAGKLTS